MRRFDYVRTTFAQAKRLRALLTLLIGEQNEIRLSAAERRLWSPLWR